MICNSQYDLTTKIACGVESAHNRGLKVTFVKMYMSYEDTCLKRIWMSSLPNQTNPKKRKRKTHTHTHTTPHPIMNTLGRSHVFNQWINKHALPVTKTKSREFQFSICFIYWCFIIDLVMEHKTWGHNFEQKKIMENRENVPNNNIHMPYVP